MKEGWLEKKGFMGSWKPYWVVLKQRALCFYSKRENKKPSSQLELDSFIVEEAHRLTNKPNTFAIFMLNHKPVLLRAKDKPEMQEWMSSLNAAGVMESLTLLDTLESMNDAVVISDRQGVIVGFNGKAIELFGYSKLDVLGKPVEVLMTQKHAQCHQQYMERYFETGEKRLIGLRRTLTAKHKSGSKIKVDISLGEIQGPYFIATFREVSGSLPPTPCPKASPSLGSSPLSSMDSSFDSGEEAEELKQQIAMLMNQKAQLESENDQLRKSKSSGGFLDFDRGSSSGNSAGTAGLPPIAENHLAVIKQKQKAKSSAEILFMDDPVEIFTKDKRIGAGSFGEVYKGTHKLSGRPVAIKILHQNIDLKALRNELDSTKVGRNPNVVMYYGAYKKHTSYWIVMEYCEGGSLKDLMTRMNAPLNESAIASSMYQTLKALEHVHKMGKIHRDIKAANLLINAMGDIKLADFSIAGQLSDDTDARHTAVGTPYWMSPEIIAGTGHTLVTDIWSLGITAIELAEKNPPYQSLGPVKAFFHITTGAPPTLTIPDRWSAEFNDFIASALKYDPSNRPSASQLLTHPFLKKANKNSLVVYLNAFPVRL